MFHVKACQYGILLNANGLIKYNYKMFKKIKNCLNVMKGGLNAQNITLSRFIQVNLQVIKLIINSLTLLYLWTKSYNCIFLFAKIFQYVFLPTYKNCNKNIDSLRSSFIKLIFQNFFYISSVHHNVSGKKDICHFK